MRTGPVSSATATWPVRGVPVGSVFFQMIGFVPMISQLATGAPVVVDAAAEEQVVADERRGVLRARRREQRVVALWILHRLRRDEDHGLRRDAGRSRQRAADEEHAARERRRRRVPAVLDAGRVEAGRREGLTGEALDRSGPGSPSARPPMMSAPSPSGNAPLALCVTEAWS